MEKEDVYISLRIVECICIGVFTFGLLWEGAEVLKLSTPEFMMLYGGIGAFISEVLARIFHKQVKKNITEETK